MSRILPVSLGFFRILSNPLEIWSDSLIISRILSNSLWFSSNSNGFSHNFSVSFRIFSYSLCFFRILQNSLWSSRNLAEFFRNFSDSFGFFLDSLGLAQSLLESVCSEFSWIDFSRSLTIPFGFFRFSRNLAGFFRNFSDSFRFFWILFDHLGIWLDSSVFFGSFRRFPYPSELFWDGIRFFRILSASTGFSKIPKYLWI